MEYVTLNNGVKMPLLGYGVYRIEDADLCEKCVVNAIDTGYRLIDTAASYLNEEAVGNGIKQSRIPREELFVTTKLWVQNAGYESAKEAFDKSLQRLQLDYVDLYLVHQPFGDVYGSWRAIEELYHQGRIRAIGVCNFYPDRLIDLIIHNRIAPAVNQIEINPFHQQWEADLFMKKYNVQAEAWSPFANGNGDIFGNEVLIAVSKKYNKSVSQIILRWLVQRGIVALAKTVNKDRMEENFDIFEFKLTQDHMSLIASLNREESSFFSHRDPDVVMGISSRYFDI